MVNGLFLQPMAFIPWSNKYIVTSSDQQHASRMVRVDTNHGDRVIDYCALRGLCDRCDLPLFFEFFWPRSTQSVHKGHHEIILIVPGSAFNIFQVVIFSWQNLCVSLVPSCVSMVKKTTEALRSQRFTEKETGLRW